MNIEPTELYIERNEEIRRTKEALQNQMQCVGELKEYLHNAQQMITALKQQIEDMQRCGNCENFVYCKTDGYIYCDIDVHPFPIKGRCDNWISDGKTRGERR